MTVEDSASVTPWQPLVPAIYPGSVADVFARVDYARSLSAAARP